MRLLRVSWILTPVTSVQAAILDSFGQVFGGDGFGVVEIGDGAGGFQYTVMSAGAQAHAAHGHFERSFTGFVERAESSEQAGRDAGVVKSSAALDGASRLYTRALFRRRSAVILAAQLLVSYGWHFHMQIDAIKKRTAYFAQVALDDGSCATAFARGVREVAAGAPLHVTTTLLKRFTGCL